MLFRSVRSCSSAVPTPTTNSTLTKTEATILNTGFLGFGGASNCFLKCVVCVGAGDANCRKASKFCFDWLELAKSSGCSTIDGGLTKSLIWPDRCSKIVGRRSYDERLGWVLKRPVNSKLSIAILWLDSFILNFCLCFVLV